MALSYLKQEPASDKNPWYNIYNEIGEFYGVIAYAGFRWAWKTPDKSLIFFDREVADINHRLHCLNRGWGVEEVFMQDLQPQENHD